MGIKPRRQNFVGTRLPRNQFPGRKANSTARIVLGLSTNPTSFKSVAVQRGSLKRPATGSSRYICILTAVIICGRYSMG
jgi:hypothetical protein